MQLADDFRVETFSFHENPQNQLQNTSGLAYFTNQLVNLEVSRSYESVEPGDEQAPNL